MLTSSLGDGEPTPSVPSLPEAGPAPEPEAAPVGPHVEPAVLRRLVWTVLAYVVLWVITPRIPAPRTMAGLVLISLAVTVIFMAVQIAIVYYYAALKLKWWQSLLALAACGACVFGLAHIISAVVKPGVKISSYFGLLRIPWTLLFIFAAASIGCAVADRVKDKNLLLPVVMFAAYIDFWTVTRGPVASMLQHAPDIANVVSAPIPLAGAGTFTPISMIGPGDFLFMGLVFAAVSRLRMNGPRNYWFVFALMTLGMLAVLIGPLTYLPALIALAIGVVAANWREFKLSRDEAISMAVVGVLLVATLPLVWHFLAPKRIKKHGPGTRPAVTAPAHKK